MLFIYGATNFGTNGAFLLKMGFMVLAGLNALAFDVCGAPLGRRLGRRRSAAGARQRLRDAVARVLALRRDDGPVDGLSLASRGARRRTRERLGGSRPALHDPRRLSHADGLSRREASSRDSAIARRRATSSSPRIRSAARPGRSTSSTCSRTTAARSRRGSGSTTCSRTSRKSARQPCARCPSRGSSRRICRSQRTPWSAQAKYVYVARNPFDCAVSFYHHTRGFVRHYDFADGDVGRRSSSASCAARSISATTSTTSCRGGRGAREPNVLFLTYERMLAAPAAAVQAIARLSRRHARPSSRATRSGSSGVVRASGFEHMRRDQERWSSARPADMPAFVRKGVVGDWRNHFSAEQARRLAEKFRARTAGDRDRGAVARPRRRRARVEP